MKEFLLLKACDISGRQLFPTAATDPSTARMSEFVSVNPEFSRLTLSRTQSDGQRIDEDYEQELTEQSLIYSEGLWLLSALP